MTDMTQTSGRGRTRARITPVDLQVAETLDKIAAIRGLTNKELGELVGQSTSSVQSKRRGGTGLTSHDHTVFAQALDVEPGTFLKPFDEAMKAALKIRWSSTGYPQVA